MNIRILYCRLSEDKKAWCVTTAHLLHQGSWLLFFCRFSLKRFLQLMSYKLILFIINITFYQGFILSVFYIWFLFSLLIMAQVVFFVSYFWAIMDFEVYEGQITKIYHGLCYLMHQVIKRYGTFSLHVSKWTQCYISFWISFWILLISKDTLMMWLEVIFQGVMKVL